jgi:hypothetical protein
MQWCEHCREQFEGDHYDPVTGVHRTGEQFGPVGRNLARLARLAELEATAARFEAALKDIMRVTDPGDVRARSTLAYWETRIQPARGIARAALGLPLGGKVKVRDRWVEVDE